MARFGEAEKAQLADRSVCTPKVSVYCDQDDQSMFCYKLQDTSSPPQSSQAMILLSIDISLFRYGKL